MFKKHYLIAMVPVAFLWGWILARAGQQAAVSWLLLFFPLCLWIVIDWLGSGSSGLSGPQKGPEAEERFFCYLFIGVGILPIVAAASGLMKLERFKPGFLPTLFGDGVDVAAFCLLGLIATSAVRLLGWSNSLFGRTQHGGTSGGGPGGGGC